MIAVGAVAVGCGSDEEGVRVRDSGDEVARLEAALAAVRDGDGRFAVREVTGFAWDKVCAYGEAASRADVERDSGGRVVLGGDFYYGPGTLLVFADAGRPVRAFALTYETSLGYSGAPRCHSSGAEVVAAPGDPTRGTATLVRLVS